MRPLVAVLLLALAPILHADEQLARLRADYATDFLNPQSHLRLSRYVREKGDPLTAFFISEAARRGYFEKAEFDRAFAVVFREDTFDNSLEAEQKLVAQLAAADDAKARAQLADIHLSREEYRKAEVELRKAIALAPDAFEYVDVLAEVLRRDDRASEAEALVKSWMEAHPATLAATRARVDTLLQTDAAAAQKAIDELLEAHPNDASLHAQRAWLLAKSDKAAAAKAYERAIELDPKNPVLHGLAGRFHLKTDEERALKHYLDAYFLDPHFSDGEHAESRIRTLAMKRATAKYQARRTAKATAAQLLSDPDPVVAGLALQELNEDWTDAATPALLTLLEHDEPNLRFGAAALLGVHLTVDDSRINRLLRHSDLRVRSAAAYIAGQLFGEDIVPVLTEWLEEPSALLRYDAITLLARHGGEQGRALLMKLRASNKVTEPRLLAMLSQLADE